MKCLFFTAGILLASMAASGQQLTLDECQQRAKENYPLIRQYSLIDETAGLTLANLQKNWLPQIALNAQATYQSDAPDFPAEMKSLFQQVIDVQGMHKDQYKIGLDISQTVWDGGKVKSDKKIAESDRLQQEKSVDVQLYQIRATVNDLYFGILLLDESLRQNRNQQELLEKNCDRILSHLENGTAMLCDADAIRVQLLSIRQQEKKIEAMRKEYSRALGIFIGQPDMTAPILEKPDVPEDPASGENRRPELALYDARLNGLDLQRKALDAAVMPKIGVFASGFYGNPGLNYIENMIHPGWSWNYMLGVSLKWNIGSFYTRKNSIRKIDAKRKSVETDRDVFLFNTNLSASRKSDKLSEIRQVIADDSDIIRLRSSIRRAAESKLQNGIIDVADLLQKITDENAAELSKASHEIELLKTLYELKNITNN